MATENIITAPFRLAFPEVFEAKASAEGGKAKFSITMLFPKNGAELIPGTGEGITAIRKVLAAACKEKWGEDKAKWPASIKALDMKSYVSPTGKDGWPLRDGDLVEWDGFAGNLFIRASSQFQPGVVDNKVKPIIDREAIYGGLICRAQVNAYAYDSNGNRGVTLGLTNLQILKDDGTTFGGKTRAEDAFTTFGDNTPATNGGSDADDWG